jgi:FKBP-type peptidyl-prolyl cis-trans isomerase
MYMNRVFNIAILVVAMAVATLFSSCKNETDTTLNSQQKSISDYLTKSHQPRLCAEVDVPNSQDSQPQFFTQWGVDIYRYIATYYDEGRESRPMIEGGDKISIIYSGYLFSGSKPSLASLFATNDETLINELIAQGLNGSYEWTTEPLEVTVGSNDLLDSISTALEGCYEGDVVEIYLTFEAGYGKKYVGMVPGKSALAWFIEIKSVTKK